MTTPVGSAPDRAFVKGSRFGQDITEASAKEAMKRPVLNPWSLAQDAFRAKRGQFRSQLADMKDGQLALNGRTDLLTRASGFGCAVMGRNWTIPQRTSVVMPFDRQVGPMKHVSVDSPDQFHGRLCIKAGGLWRVDVLMSLEYWAFKRVILLEPLAPGSTVMIPHTYDYEKTVTPSYALEVVDAGGALVTAREFIGTSAVTELVTKDKTPPHRRQSNAFAHTFVLPEMPPDDDPAAPDHWAYVRLSATWTSVAPTGEQLFGASFGKFLGGTEKCGLVATRWSPDASHVNYQPVVPDGGTLP